MCRCIFICVFSMFCRSFFMVCVAFCIASCGVFPYFIMFSELRYSFSDLLSIMCLVLDGYIIFSIPIIGIPLLVRKLVSYACHMSYPMNGGLLSSMLYCVLLFFRGTDTSMCGA